MLQRPGRLVGNRGHLAVHVEQLALIQAETFHDVISVHRSDECTTPRCCGERILHGFLSVTHLLQASYKIGVAVS